MNRPALFTATAALPILALAGFLGLRSTPKEQAPVVQKNGFDLPGGEAKAYPIESLPPNQPVRDRVGGVELELSYDPATCRPQVIALADGSALPYVTAYWFAWQAFDPNTGLWKP